MSNIYNIFGTLLQESSFNTLSKVRTIVRGLGTKEQRLIKDNVTLSTFLEMIQEEYDYRTQCDECRDSANLEPSVKY